MDAPAPAAPATATHEAGHDEAHVHTYETSGISEADARIPRWLMAVIVTLFVFFGGYIVMHWSAQPSTAHAK